jgi:O-antigen biosynthesis protein
MYLKRIQFVSVADDRVPNADRSIEPRLSPRPLPRSMRPQVEGKFLRVGGRRFWVRGVTYGTFRANSRGELFPEPEVVARDFEQMAAAGVNTLRTYTAPPRWLLDLALEHCLMVVAGLFWEGRECLFEDRHALDQVVAGVRREMKALAGHPALLMVCIGNEIPPLVARWHGRQKIERLLRRLRDAIKAVDPDALVTYASYPPTEFLDLSFLDVIGFNVYLEQEQEFRDYLARLQILAGDRPLLVTELGLDSRRNGVERQAQVLDWQLQAVAEKGLAGALVYAWTDEWAVAGVPIEDWDFGLVDRDRHAKPALATVAWHFQHSRYDLWELNEGEWPRVSVVCCAYNAAATLEETLASLARLEYPDYEVIVVDDPGAQRRPQPRPQHRHPRGHGPDRRLPRRGRGGRSRLALLSRHADGAAGRRGMRGAEPFALRGSGSGAARGPLAGQPGAGTDRQ